MGKNAKKSMKTVKVSGWVPQGAGHEVKAENPAVLCDFNELSTNEIHKNTFIHKCVKITEDSGEFLMKAYKTVETETLLQELKHISKWKKCTFYESKGSQWDAGTLQTALWHVRSLAECLPASLQIPSCWFQSSEVITRDTEQQKQYLKKKTTLLGEWLSR